MNYNNKYIQIMENRYGQNNNHSNQMNNKPSNNNYFSNNDHDDDYNPYEISNQQQQCNHVQNTNPNQGKQGYNQVFSNQQQVQGLQDQFNNNHQRNNTTNFADQCNQYERQFISDNHHQRGVSNPYPNSSQKPNGQFDYNLQQKPWKTAQQAQWQQQNHLQQDQQNQLPNQNNHFQFAQVKQVQPNPFEDIPSQLNEFTPKTNQQHFTNAQQNIQINFQANIQNNNQLYFQLKERTNPEEGDRGQTNQNQNYRQINNEFTPTEKGHHQLVQGYINNNLTSMNRVENNNPFTNQLYSQNERDVRNFNQVPSYKYTYYDIELIEDLKLKIPGFISMQLIEEAQVLFSQIRLQIERHYQQDDQGREERKNILHQFADANKIKVKEMNNYLQQQEQKEEEKQNTQVFPQIQYEVPVVQAQKENYTEQQQIPLNQFIRKLTQFVQENKNRLNEFRVLVPLDTQDISGLERDQLFYQTPSIIIKENDGEFVDDYTVLNGTSINFENQSLLKSIIYVYLEYQFTINSLFYQVNDLIKNQLKHLRVTEQNYKLRILRLIYLKFLVLQSNKSKKEMKQFLIEVFEYEYLGDLLLMNFMNKIKNINKKERFHSELVRNLNNEDYSDTEELTQELANTNNFTLIFLSKCEIKQILSNYNKVPVKPLTFFLYFADDLDISDEQQRILIINKKAELFQTWFSENYLDDETKDISFTDFQNIE